MRNKIVSILLIATVAISLSACGSTENSDGQVEDLENQIAELQQQLEEVQQETTGNNNDSDNNNNSSVSASINESTAETWGVCGADLTWYYQNNILVIRGTGEMTNYGGDTDTIPWREIRDDIQWIIIEDGCTSITSYAFIACQALSKVEIPNSVTDIGEGAFERCNNLVNITIPDSITFIGGWAFKHCDSLEEVVIPNENADIDEHAFDTGTRVMVGGTEIIWENPDTALAPAPAH